MELISNLVEQLGVSEEQASGGVGLLLKMAKEKLGDGDFSQLSNLLPETNQLIDAAPEEEKSSGLMGSIGGLVSSLGGGGGSSLGNLATLAGGFSQLGLDAGMITKFLPIVLSFFQGKGDDGVQELLGGLFGGGDKE
ncbi:hypothetical protein MNBD_PLANCTO02-2220 [hydrothermal vent metagenome]|uniref:DUF2780 domain-containing protein n=1 Tax=hydrothermal vent metagenome TaxID=652676 RepID=A0A3B1DJA1_9ZZZZ